MRETPLSKIKGGQRQLPNVVQSDPRVRGVPNIHSMPQLAEQFPMKHLVWSPLVECSFAVSQNKRPSRMLKEIPSPNKILTLLFGNAIG